jgi:hypothetical protein
MTRAKPQLTVPESPLFATTDRSEVRREAAQREAERAAHAAELAKMEDDVRERSERLAARHYVAQRRALTVPESPALLTKMRGEVHAERFEALVLEEEARAEQLEAESRAPLRRVDNNQPGAARAQAEAGTDDSGIAGTVDKDARRRSDGCGELLKNKKQQKKKNQNFENVDTVAEAVDFCLFLFLRER